ncbi:MAG: alpha/beta fold hydrolase, partial [Actinomycetota bacterium]
MRTGAHPGDVHADVLGDGPDVVLVVHGVGFGPETMGAVAGLLADGATVAVVHRRGYGRSAGLPASGGIDDEVRDLAGVADRMGAPRVHLVGVSGGATIGLAFALSHPQRVASAVLHEPALGPLAPGVWNLLIDLSIALGRIREPQHAGRVFGETLAGRAGWAALPLEARDGVARAGDAVQHEVPHFAAFTPAAEELARLRRLPLVTTLGA